MWLDLELCVREEIVESFDKLTDGWMQYGGYAALSSVRASSEDSSFGHRIGLGWSGNLVLVRISEKKNRCWFGFWIWAYYLGIMAVFGLGRCEEGLWGSRKVRRNDKQVGIVLSKWDQGGYQHSLSQIPSGTILILIPYIFVLIAIIRKCKRKGNEVSCFDLWKKILSLI